MCWLWCTITVRHFLLECDDFSKIIYKYYPVNSMLFQDTFDDNIKI